MKEALKDTRSIHEKLADGLEDAKYSLVITGAGFSTNAGIPSYQGKNGIATALKKQGATFNFPDLRETKPTIAHCILKILVQKGLVSHIVSQNCDGLHLRSGVPESKISEIHGNTFIEFCPKCKIHYKRPFEVSWESDEDHKTPRKCEKCTNPLYDTIVKAGEIRSIEYPQNWAPVYAAFDKIELIIILGSSCEVLAGYGHVLFPSKAQVYIVNQGPIRPVPGVKMTQINEDCDNFMQKLFACFKFPETYPSYCQACDPLLNVSCQVGITDWPQCSCGKRQPRNLVEDLKPHKLTMLSSREYPSWVHYRLPKTQQNNNRKRRRNN